MDEIKMGSEIYLEPEVEKIKNAKEIAQASKNAEKYVFCIKYEATEKSVVLSEIKRLECEILEQSDSKSYVKVEASIAQLAAIKTLNCIEKIEVVDTSTTQKNSLNKTEENDIMSVKTVEEPAVVLAQTNEAVSVNDEIALMCYDDCDNDCEHSNTMQTAISLPIGVWKNGCICCPGAEVWYKFTANIGNASEYIIYSSGLTDVVAELYDSNGMYITRGDDEEGYPNFNITRELTYGCTYYVKVYAYGSNTGEYNVRINYNTVSSGGSDDCDCSNNQASAIQLNLNIWQNGCICCYGAETWYKFTPVTTAHYTIYTLGSLDTAGSMYDADCNWLNGSNDDGFGNNFKIVHRLVANQTYYIKVMAFGSDTGNYEIVVTDNVFVDSVTVNEEVVILDKGKTQTLSATILPEYATNKALYWESDNTDVVTVNSSTGKITAIDGGKACVCAYAQDGSGKSSCCEVFVNVPVESVTMDTSTRVMRVGEESQFTATVCPENAGLKDLIWESTKPKYATVDYDGLVTAVGEGDTVIKAISKDNENIYGECAVKVKEAIRVQGITMCEETYTMNVGETKYLSYDIYPSDATNQKVSWCSSNPEVAFVQYYTGEITALKAGTTTITATTDDGSFVASCDVRVVIEAVTIKKDGGYNKVFFHSSGKVWHCIGCDVIFDEENKHNLEFIERSNYNFFATYRGHGQIDTSEINTYTNDELRLLYAIDPCGVAKYINRFADDEGNTLEQSLEIKDEKFEVLFGRAPNYYIQLMDGRWDVYNGTKDIDVQFSESEAYFGINARLRPGYTWVINLIDFASSLLCAISNNEGFDKAIESAALVIKVGIYCHNEDYLLAFNEVVEELAGNVFDPSDDENKEYMLDFLDGVFDLLAVLESFNTLVEELTIRPKYFRAIIDYCVTKVDYDVTVELLNGEKCKLTEVNKAIFEQLL